MEDSKMEDLKTQEVPEKKESKFLKFVMKHKYYVALIIVIIVVLAWSFIRMALMESDFKEEKAQITSNYEMKLDGLNSDRLKLTATTFSWAIRSELLRENKEQINQYFNEFIKNPDIVKLQLINSETSIVELSTDKKDVGIEVTKYNSLQEQTIVTDSTEFQIVTPITGLNKKLGVFVMQVNSLKHK
ncbi:MAG: hypothetical protein CVV25_11430 [Ignavibacteriae bacterium HGW-Ignavibacteriae-4]|jgi:uncharacterized membrane protein affecting hemolysin expression|nr:MAG: hypothetical protein CVV25_11430 [Ignavibacteriae bacterium HGW-Ignavibacteriae-4]